MRPKPRKPQDGDTRPCDDCGEPMRYIAKRGVWVMSCTCGDVGYDWDDWDDNDCYGHDDECDL